MGLQAAAIASQIDLNNSQAEKKQSRSQKNLNRRHTIDRSSNRLYKQLKKLTNAKENTEAANYNLILQKQSLVFEQARNLAIRNDIDETTKQTQIDKVFQDFCLGQITAIEKITNIELTEQQIQKIGKEIAYVCKYMYEKSMIPSVLKEEKSYHPFVLCSRNPGIGFGFMKADIINFYRLHPRDYVRAWSGYRIAMPRYYADKLYDDDMKAFLKEMREEFFRQKMHEQWLHFCSLTPAQAIKTDLMQIEQCQAYEKRMAEKLRCKS